MGSMPSFPRSVLTLLRAGTACQPSGVLRALTLRSVRAQSPWPTSREWPVAAIASGIAIAIMTKKLMPPRDCPNPFRKISNPGWILFFKYLFFTNICNINRYSKKCN